MDNLIKIHNQAKSQFADIQSAIRDERLLCLQDRRFYSIPGAQWEGSLSEQFENKPRFEVNKIHLSVIRIINEYRNNKIGISFVPRGGSKDEDLSDTLAGLLRADEQDSGAQEAYDNAFEEAVGGGFGAFRLRTEYVDDESIDDDRQRIRIEPIYDADSCVFFDLTAKRQDKADAKYCYVLTAMTREAYRDEWGEDPSDWPKEVRQDEFDWATPDLVYVAEYYQVEEVGDTVCVYQHIDGSEERILKSALDEEEELLQKLEMSGAIKIKEKKIKQKKVRKYLMSASRILEDYGHIAGKCIPVIPVYGKRWVVDGIERCMGHVRLAKDSQRIKNMQLSKLGEISALSSTEKPILLPEQVAGHQVMWHEDNIKDYPYLLINPITGADGSTIPSAPIGYTKPAQIPPALAGLLQITESDMAEILGNQQQAEKMVSNISGKAVEMIQSRIDMQAYIYMSNFSKGIKRAGEVWLSMAKEVYYEPDRPMKIITDDDESDQTVLMQPMLTPEGAYVYKNDLSKADMEVSVDVGPSSMSKRQAIVKSLVGMMQVTSDPETQQVLGAMAVMNMDGEGLGDVKNYYRRRLVKQGVIKPTDKEAEDLMAEMQNQPKDPNSVFFEAAAEEAQAKAAKARAEVIETINSAQLIEAKTADISGKSSQASTQPDARLSAETQKAQLEIIKMVREIERAEELHAAALKKSGIDLGGDVKPTTSI